MRKERRVPRVRWEGLMNEEKRAEYEEKTRQRWESSVTVSTDRQY